MLNKVISDKQIKTDPQSLEFWGKDWTHRYIIDPMAIVFPDSNDQVIDIVNYALKNNIKLAPSGGRTGLSGGAVASHKELAVSFDRMNTILNFNEHDRLVTCQAGVITQSL